MASSRQLTTRQQMGGISPYPNAVVRAAADRCRCYTAVCCPSKKNWGGGAKWKMYPPLIHLSAGHHVLGKKCVFIAGSFLKKSVFKAGTTVDKNVHQNGQVGVSRLVSRLVSCLVPRLVPYLTRDATEVRRIALFGFFVFRMPGLLVQKSLEERRHSLMLGNTRLCIYLFIFAYLNWSSGCIFGLLKINSVRGIN